MVSNLFSILQEGPSFQESWKGSKGPPTHDGVSFYSQTLGRECCIVTYYTTNYSTKLERQIQSHWSREYYIHCQIANSAHSRIAWIYSFQVYIKSSSTQFGSFSRRSRISQSGTTEFNACGVALVWSHLLRNYLLEDRNVCGRIF